MFIVSFYLLRLRLWIHDKDRALWCDVCSLRLRADIHKCANESLFYTIFCLRRVVLINKWCLLLVAWIVKFDGDFLHVVSISYYCCFIITICNMWRLKMLSLHFMYSKIIMCKLFISDCVWTTANSISRCIACQALFTVWQHDVPYNGLGKG